MAKRNRNNTASTLQRRWDEGRGQGTGANYHPWLQVQDVPSTGLTTRVMSWKAGRIHHLLSQLETNYFYLLEWSTKVSDIREQYPLYPVEESRSVSPVSGKFSA